MLDDAANFAKVTVSGAYGASDVAITVTPVAILPTAPFNLTWWNVTDYADPSDDPDVEIVRCTGIAGNILNVVRAQEGTDATVKNLAGKTYKMVAGITAKVINIDLPATFGGGGGYSPDYQEFNTVGMTVVLPTGQDANVYLNFAPTGSTDVIIPDGSVNGQKVFITFNAPSVPGGTVWDLEFTTTDWGGTSLGLGGSNGANGFSAPYMVASVPTLIHPNPTPAGVLLVPSIEFGPLHIPQPVLGASFMWTSQGWTVCSITGVYIPY